MKKRNNCEICASTNLELFHTIKHFPVRMGVAESNTTYTYGDLQYVECQNCNNVQIFQLPNLTDVYETNHNISVIGKKWQNHYQELSQFIFKVLKKKNSRVLEVGDPNAKIASLLCASDYIHNWTIVEPNPASISLPKLQFITTFFDTQFSSQTTYDALIMSHLFEHLIGIRQLLPIMHNIVNDTGIVMLSVPNLEHILQEGSMAPAGIHFEHTFYFNREILERLFQEFGFTLTSYEAFEDHSEFFCFKKCIPQKVTYKDINKDNVREKIMKTFAKKKTKLDRFNTMLTDTAYDSRFLYGAHIQTQMFASMGLYKEQITGVLDNDTTKHNKYVYGTDFKVFPTKDIAQFHHPLIFCEMGPYTNEITKQILAIHPNAQII